MITINIYGGDNSLQIHSTDSSSPIICNIYGGQNLIHPEVKIVQDEKSEEKTKLSSSKPPSLTIEAAFIKMAYFQP